MTYDAGAWIHNEADGLMIQHSGVAKRWKYGLDALHCKLNRADASEIKKKAHDAVTFWDFEQGIMGYESPGADSPFCRRGVAVMVKWTLATPFFSRSETELDAVDNPVSRDSLSGRPILKSTGFKGMLRQIAQNADPALSNRLFGEILDSNAEEGQAGCVVFGDVVFKSAPGSDILSPHDRRFGVVDHPVGFEVVRKGVNAEVGFLLYERVPRELGVHASLKLLLESIQSLLTVYGMSAKRTVGFGMASHDSIKIELRLGSAITLPKEFDKHLSDIPPFPEPEPTTPKIDFPNSLKEVECVFMPKGTLIPKDNLVENVSNADAKRQGKTSPKQIANIKSDWEKKDKKSGKTKADQVWEEFDQFIRRKASVTAEALQEANRRHAEWLKRRREYERAHPRFYKFESIAAALRAIAKAEVAP